ncbi:FtsX-like permease family protein [Streptomyces sp. ST2-7A]|uniref:FtsX-like permease family protein n=1 Tax=Streptomyces sp. ST2-7A TaxID=2907214 RepID=UPI001F3B57E4|nr:ABC transporter permease [Streptomyces sp. ST2-7A]MCE7078684.1 ABC transporter permease [Streptomyces sp. ST2-7A]
MKTENRLVQVELLRSLRRHWLIPVVLSLLVSFSVLARGAVHEAQATVEELDTRDGLLRTINVWADTPDGRTPLTRERINTIANFPRVTAVTPYGGGGGEAYLSKDKDRSDPRMLTLLPLTAAHPTVVAGQEKQEAGGKGENSVFLERDEILMPEGFSGLSAEDLIGQEIVVLHTPVEHIERDERGSEAMYGGDPEELFFTVTAVHNDTLGNLDGPGTAYVHPDVATTVYAGMRGATVEEIERGEGYDSLRVEAASAQDVPEVQRMLREAGLYAASVTAQMRGLSPAMAMLDTATNVALWALLGLGLLFGLVLGTQRVRSRMSEIGLLKALGFTDTRILRLLAMELFALGFIAALIGVGLGLGVTLLLFGGTKADLLLGLTLLPVPGLVLLLGALFPLHYVRRLPPDTVLRNL